MHVYFKSEAWKNDAGKQEETNLMTLYVQKSYVYIVSRYSFEEIIMK